jgi:PEP-CTERM motif
MKLSSAKFQPNHSTTYSPLRRMLGVLSVLALALVIAPVSAHASLLLPGTTVFPDPLAPPTGTTEATISGSWTTATMSGTYSESVIAATNNTFCSGCLDFVINVSNNASSRDSIETISTGAFGLFLTDVGFNTASTGVIPFVVDRSTTGDVINFAYFQPNVIHPGQSSAELIIETNATHFTAGTISLIDQFTATVNGFAPTTIPEPASMALLGAGFLAFGSALRRKK